MNNNIENISSNVAEATKPPTEAPTKPPTEAATEPAAPEPTEAATKLPTEATKPPTEAVLEPTKVATEAALEATTKPPTEAALEPTKPPTEALEPAVDGKGLVSAAVDKLSKRATTGRRVTTGSFKARPMPTKEEYDRLRLFGVTPVGVTESTTPGHVSERLTGHSLTSPRPPVQTVRPLPLSPLGRRDMRSTIMANNFCRVASQGTRGRRKPHCKPSGRGQPH